MFDSVTTYIATAAQSDFFAGGVALGLMGSAVAFARLFWMRTARFVRRRIWAELTLDNRTQSFRHACLWMEANGVLTDVRRQRVTDATHGNGHFVPAPGRHWFWRDGRLCYLDRALSEKARVGGGYDARPMEALTFGILFGGIDRLRGWVREGAAIASERARRGPALFLMRDGYWESLGDMPARSIATVLTEGGIAEGVLEDMRGFYGASDWYAARGVPWRRGYLFHGPPGTGKSSLIRALASELRLDIASLDVGRAGLTDDGLRQALATAPARALVAIEDIDAIFAERKAGEHVQGVSFSGLLNALDGVGAQEGRAVVMTTNHRERLDPALIRPGRADVHVALGLVGAEVAERLFLRFFPKEAGHAAAFRECLGEARLSPAALQAWLLANSQNAGEAAKAEALLQAHVAEPMLAAE